MSTETGSAQTGRLAVETTDKIDLEDLNPNLDIRVQVAIHERYVPVDAIPESKRPDPVSRLVRIW